MELKQKLNVLDATMIVAGSMIGSGIFIVSADIVRQVGSAGWLLIVWLLTGLLTMIAALSYGELSGMFPKAGGQYVYLREAWGKPMGFLYGWSLFGVIQTGTIAAVGVAFAKFAGYFFSSMELNDSNIILQLGSFKLYKAQILSIVIITFLSWLNALGVRHGKLLQNVFTSTKLIALFGLLILGFILGFQHHIWQANWQDAFSLHKLSESSTNITGLAIVGAISVAMVGSLFSSDAWNNITFIAAEVLNPKRTITLSLALGTGVVTLIYILMNIMYIGCLSLHEIAFAPNDRVGVAVAEKILGTSGTYVVAALIMISTFGCINGMILSGARVYHTMALDGLFFNNIKKVNKNHVPAKALWMQCIWASLLCLSGKYGDLLDYVVFAVLLFYILTILGIFKLRKTKPHAERPYKTIGYPILPLLYIIVTSILCICLLIYKPAYTWPGLGIVLAGLPVYYLMKK